MIRMPKHWLRSFIRLFSDTARIPPPRDETNPPTIGFGFGVRWVSGSLRNIIGNLELFLDADIAADVVARQPFLLRQWFQSERIGSAGQRSNDFSATRFGTRQALVRRRCWRNEQRWSLRLIGEKRRNGWRRLTQTRSGV